MHILLADDDGFEVRIDLPEAVSEPLLVQLDRMNELKKLDAFKLALVKEFASMLAGFLDPDISPPTEKQLVFARSLARAQGIAVPREALMYKAAMYEFLDRHATKR